MDNGKFNFEYFSNLYNSHLYVTAINYALDHLENNSEIISLINHKVSAALNALEAQHQSAFNSKNSSSFYGWTSSPLKNKIDNYIRQYPKKLYKNKYLSVKKKLVSMQFHIALHLPALS